MNSQRGESEYGEKLTLQVIRGTISQKLGKIGEEMREMICGEQ